MILENPPTHHRLTRVRALSFVQKPTDDAPRIGPALEGAWV